MIFTQEILPGSITFDNYKPGKRNYDGAQEAEKRYLKASGQKKLPVSTQRHHANWDRADGRAENIIIAKNQKQHDNWHHQLINWVRESVNSGLLKFSIEEQKYYANDTYVVDKIKAERQRELNRRGAMPFNRISAYQVD